MDVSNLQALIESVECLESCNTTLLVDGAMRNVNLKLVYHSRLFITNVKRTFIGMSEKPNPLQLKYFKARCAK